MSSTDGSLGAVFLSFVYAKMTKMKIMNTFIETIVPDALIVSIKPQTYSG